MKSVLTLAVLALMLVGTSAFAQNASKGDFKVDGNTEGYSLGSGSGARTQPVFVKFDKKFAAAPVVIVTLTGFSGNAGSDGKMNISVSAENITTEGFVAKVGTWGDTKLAAVYGSWLAVKK